MSISDLILSFFEPTLDACRQRQLLNVVDTRVLPDHETAEVLQRADLGET